jgi:hypothetical protein
MEFAIQKFKEVQDKYGYVTKYLLAEHSERSVKTCTYYLIELNKKDLIRCIEKAKDKYGHNLLRKYKII